MKAQTLSIILGLAVAGAFASTSMGACGSDSNGGGGAGTGGMNTGGNTTTNTGGTTGTGTTTTPTTGTGTTTTPPTTTTPGTGGSTGAGGAAACQAGCAADHPEGAMRAQNDVIQACACAQGTPCTGAQGACTDAGDVTACQTNMYQNLSQACAACVQDQANMQSSCALSGALGSDCQGDADCAAFVSCVIGCSQGGG